MISSSLHTPTILPSSASSTGWPVAWRNRMMDCREKEAGTTASPGSTAASAASSPHVAQHLLDPVEMQGEGLAATAHGQPVTAPIVEPESAVLGRQTRPLGHDHARR